MPAKSIAIVAAMRSELAPLLRNVRAVPMGKVELFELEDVVVAVGGIGRVAARNAAEMAIEYARPKLILSAGLGGAVSPQRKVGDVGRIREVIDVATGARYSTSGGEWVLATTSDVNDAAGKQELLTRYGADVVDMEAAAVAQVAREQGVQFAALKAISDDAQVALPPLMRFVDEDGQFSTARFLAYVALRPKWWTSVNRLRANSKVASVSLCRELEHLIESSRSQLLAASGPLATKS